MIPRVVDTSGIIQANDYIVKFLGDLGWTIEVNKFTQETVIGEKTFRNIIATRNPRSPRRLVLAAHYDTKISPEVRTCLLIVRPQYNFLRFPIVPRGSLSPKVL